MYEIDILIGRITKFKFCSNTKSFNENKKKKDNSDKFKQILDSEIEKLSNKK